MHYLFYTPHPASHYLHVDFTVSENKAEELHLQLPSWRPGRYELGNFAKNIRKFEALNDKGHPLLWKKQNKDLWIVQTAGATTINIRYSYFAFEINAGSTYVDEEQLYVNPVNCCLYVPDRMDEEHEIELQLPATYRVAGILPCSTNKQMKAASFDELADSPFFASANIQSMYFTTNGVKFHLHFNGACKPAKDKLLHDFSRFCEETISYFKDAPVKEYHFLFQVLPYKFYHGVEHKSGTVIALGPGYNLMHGDTYADLLGVSCHELFHTWNIKTIRPAEMLPYDFTKENYARTGYVYEGITTYYGDKLLLSSGVFSPQQYFHTLEERLNKHFHNYGRFNLSLADSSWDTWLDGYVTGAPYRKVSIYDEGNLIAFMLDTLIMRETANTKSLRDVMRMLYTDFYKKDKGYTEQDIPTLVHFVAGISFDDFFTHYVYGTETYENQLQECLAYLGLGMEKYSGHHLYEHLLGIKAVDQGTYKKVSLVAPDSPAWNAGIMLNDEIIAVNGHQVKNDLNALLHFYGEGSEKINLTVISNSSIKTLELMLQEQVYFPLHKIVYLKEAGTQQKQNFTAWAATNKMA